MSDFSQTFNKVIVKTSGHNLSVIDLSNDTVAPNNLYSGITAHDRTGTAIIGTSTNISGDETVYENCVISINPLEENSKNIPNGIYIKDQNRVELTSHLQDRLEMLSGAEQEGLLPVNAQIYYIQNQVVVQKQQLINIITMFKTYFGWEYDKNIPNEYSVTNITELINDIVSMVETNKNNLPSGDNEVLTLGEVMVAWENGTIPEVAVDGGDHIKSTIITSDMVDNLPSITYKEE